MRRRAWTASLFLLALTAAPGHAQHYPAYTQYCMDTSFRSTGTIPVCRYYTLEQCLAARSRNERCFLNPAFANEGPRRHRRGG